MNARRYFLMSTGLLLLFGICACKPKNHKATKPAASAVRPDSRDIHAQALPAPDENQASATPVDPPELGMNVVILPGSTEVIDIRILFASGSVDDPPDKPGLTALTAQLMAEGGTAGYSYPELLDKLYPMAAAVQVQTDRQMVVFAGRVHRDHFDAYLPLLAEVLTRPRFDPQAFQRLRTDALNEIRKTLRESDDEQLSLQALDTWLFDKHPYGHLVVGSVAGLQAITLDDVRQQAHRVFSQDRLTIGLSGPVDEKLATRVRTALQTLPVSGATPVTIAAPEPVDGIHVRIIEKQTDSTAITMGYPLAVGRHHADYYPLWLATSALGEHRKSNGRLYQTIREARGLNYGDYAYIEPYIKNGQVTRPVLNIGRAQHAFSIWIRPVQHAHRLFALRLALSTLDHFIKDGLTAAELERAKSFLEGYTRVFENSQDRRLGYALDDRFYGAGQPYLEQARAAFRSMTLEQVNAAVRAHLQLQNLKIVIVTNDAAGLKEQLAAKTPASITYDTPKPADILEADKQMAAFDPGIRADRITVVPVAELFEK